MVRMAMWGLARLKLRMRYLLFGPTPRQIIGLRQTNCQ